MQNTGNIALIGAGQYGRSCYVSYFLRHKNPRLKVCVDLENSLERPKIEAYCAKFPDETRPARIYLPKGMSKEEVLNFLTNLKQEFALTGIILSTPPEDRMEYFEAAMHLGLNILADKPLTAPKNVSVNPEAVEQFMLEYYILCGMYERSNRIHGNSFEVMVQRRYHPVFLYILDKLQEVSAFTGCPLTHFQGTHADGQWRTPQEHLDIEYHGVNKGQGKASHSGYHFYDIAANYARRTLEAAGKNADTVAVHSVPTFAPDCAASLTNADYARLFPGYHPINEQTYPEQTKGFGEVDCISTMNFLSNGRSLCSGNLNLLHNSFSGRYWLQPNLDDLYRSNGRLRQELHYFVQGPFQSISVVSLRGCSKVPVAQRIEEDSAKEPLVIQVFRNTGINRRWKAYEQVTIADLIPGLEVQDAHLQFARDHCITCFLSDISHSNILTHRWGVAAMGAACRSIATGQTEKEPLK